MTTPFNWSKSCAYGDHQKTSFHRAAKRRLKELTVLLGWPQFFLKPSMSIALANAEWNHSADRTLLGEAHAHACKALRDEEVDAAMISDALLSLFRAGEQDRIKLSAYAVATTLRHLCAGQR